MILGFIKYRIIKNIFIDRLKKVDIQEFNNNYIINIINDGKINYEKIVKKVIKFIKQYKINTIVFANEIEEGVKEFIIKQIEQEKYGVDILNGKKLMKYMDFEIIDYILEKQKTNMENEEIYILFNDKNLNFKTNIENLKEYLLKYIKNFKITNLISDDIRKLKKMQEEILDEENILISVSNNKKKALKRAKYMLNINLNQTQLEKYSINREVVIINLEETIYYENPSFDGININSIELKIPDEYLEYFEIIENEFNKMVLYEAIMKKYIENIKTNPINMLNTINKKTKNRLEYIIKQKLQEDNVKIDYLIGNKGPIHEDELKRLVKNQTNELDKTKKIV